MPNPVRERIARGELCRFLRTKGMYVFGDEAIPEESPYPPDTAVFWCNRSGWAMGPDHVPANPVRCAAACGRECFESDVVA